MDTLEAVARIRDSGARVFVASTGAGAGLQRQLWSLPGCSAFLVGAAFPYATESTDEFLGFRPERYCSPEAALDLATEAFLRAGAGAHAIGIGLTGSVASNEVHRGEHRVHVAWMSARGAATHDLVLHKGQGVAARATDGELSDGAGLNALLDALGEPLLPCDALTYSVTNRDDLARERFFARPWFRPDGTRAARPSTLRAALPGTFDPPHPGHLGMAAAFEEATGRRPTLWITAEPPHKPPASLGDLLHRARQLRGHDVLFTRGEPLYLDKARAHPGCTFVIGADALARMLDPAWGVDVDVLVAELRALDTRFHVVDRVVDGRLLTLDSIPGAPRDLCTSLPGRWDVSSTELRRAG